MKTKKLKFGVRYYSGYYISMYFFLILVRKTGKLKIKFFKFSWLLSLISRQIRGYIYWYWDHSHISGLLILSLKLRMSMCPKSENNTAAKHRDHGLQKYTRKYTGNNVRSQNNTYTILTAKKVNAQILISKEGINPEKSCLCDLSPTILLLCFSV